MSISHRFLELQSSLHGLQGCAPLHGGGLGDILEDNLASSLVLVLDELLPVFPLLVRVLLEVGREPAVSDVISVKVVSLVWCTVKSICRDSQYLPWTCRRRRRAAPNWSACWPGPRSPPCSSAWCGKPSSVVGWQLGLVCDNVLAVPGPSLEQQLQPASLGDGKLLSSPPTQGPGWARAPWRPLLATIISGDIVSTS